jgi:hypothetical protein
VERWCRQENFPQGAILAVPQACNLGRTWYADRLDPNWRRKTKEETEAIFTSLGLTSDFWKF